MGDTLKRRVSVTLGCSCRGVFISAIGNSRYHIIPKKNSNEFVKLLAENGQIIMLMVDLIEQSRLQSMKLLKHMRSGP